MIYDAGIRTCIPAIGELDEPGLDHYIAKADESMNSLMPSSHSRCFAWCFSKTQNEGLTQAYHLVNKLGNGHTFKRRQEAFY